MCARTKCLYLKKNHLESNESIESLIAFHLLVSCEASEKGRVGCTCSCIRVWFTLRVHLSKLRGYEIHIY